VTEVAVNDARVSEIDVPAAVHALQLLDHVDYEDAYAVDTNSDRTAQEWMRRFIQDAPRWFQLPWVGLGTVLLGARFGPLRAPGYVLGWQILTDSSGMFAVGLDSKAGLSARLIALTSPGHAVIATQIRLATRYAQTLWPPIRRGHRYFAPYLLSRAAALDEPFDTSDVVRSGPAHGHGSTVGLTLPTEED
jgi:hypothetical protein